MVDNLMTHNFDTEEKIRQRTVTTAVAVAGSRAVSGGIEQVSKEKTVKTVETAEVYVFYQEPQI